jgi:RNA polymerase sigma factor (sigma-70 family)
MPLSTATDGVLLAKYAYECDTEAFGELSNRYAGLVYGVCLRITRSPHEAEELARTCFIKLAQNSASIQVSLPRWLHTLARGLARTTLQDGATRQDHEQVTESGRGSAAEPTWDDVSPKLDRLLQELPEKLRDPLISRYLVGRAPERIARALGIDEAAVRERLEQGANELSEKLRKTGVTVPAAALAALLETHATVAPPSTLVDALGNMAFEGIRPTTLFAGTAIRDTKWLAAAQGKVAVVTIVIAAAAGGLLAHLTRPRIDTDVKSAALEDLTVGADTLPSHPDWSAEEPEIAFVPVPGASMGIHKTGFGTGILWCSHLRVGRSHLTRWYDSPQRSLESIARSTVTRTVRLLGRECFEVLIVEQKRAGETKTSHEYFWVAEDGTHWIRPRAEGEADLADDAAWELQDEEEGVEPHEISTQAPPEDSTVEVVNLSVGGTTTRCLRETFVEQDPGYDGAGGDAFYRADGTCIYYRRLLVEGAKEYDSLAGAPEYILKGKTYRVWYSVVLVAESPASP